MKKIYLTLTAEDAAADAMNRTLASIAVLTLARVLQRAAFAEPQHAAYRAELGLEGEFRPAPLYLSQAVAAFADPVLAEEIRTALPTKKA